jgi:hypothetical protein
MSFPGDLGPGINNVNIREVSLIHIQGGVLYVVNMTGHML